MSAKIKEKIENYQRGLCARKRDKIWRNKSKRKKNTEHEQIQQMAKKNKNETWNDFMNMGRIGYNS